MSLTKKYNSRNISCLVVPVPAEPIWISNGQTNMGAEMETSIVKSSYSTCAKTIVSKTLARITLPTGKEMVGMTRVYLCY
jgi:hypothetical protein